MSETANEPSTELTSLASERSYDERKVPTARMSWHTQRFLIVLYALAIAFGLLDPAEESDLAFVLSVGVSFSMAWWTITDASDRGRPFRMSIRVLVILVGWLVAPLYLLWTKRLKGAAWVLLHAAGFILTSKIAYWLPRVALGETDIE